MGVSKLSVEIFNDLVQLVFDNLADGSFPITAYELIVGMRGLGTEDEHVSMIFTTKQRLPNTRRTVKNTYNLQVSRGRVILQYHDAAAKIRDVIMFQRIDDAFYWIINNERAQPRLRVFHHNRSEVNDLVDIATSECGYCLLRVIFRFPTIANDVMNVSIAYGDCVQWVINAV